MQWTANIRRYTARGTSARRDKKMHVRFHELSTATPTPIASVAARPRRTHSHLIIAVSSSWISCLSAYSPRKSHAMPPIFSYFSRRCRESQPAYAPPMMQLRFGDGRRPADFRAHISWRQSLFDGQKVSHGRRARSRAAHAYRK